VLLAVRSYNFVGKLALLAGGVKFLSLQEKCNYTNVSEKVLVGLLMTV
jgi:hypothetical protein